MKRGVLVRDYINERLPLLPRFHPAPNFRDNLVSVVPFACTLCLCLCCPAFRGMILIDYDDGTQELSRIPDSDVVIYPWRPPELRVPPRPLEQALREERDGKAGNHANASRSNKLPFKPDGSRQVSPRRRRLQGRERVKEQSRARLSTLDLGKSNGRGAVKPESPSSSSDDPEESEEDDDDDDEDEDDEEEDDEEDDDKQWSEEGSVEEREMTSGGGRKDRWQRRSLKSFGRRRPSVPAQMPRKRASRSRRSNGASKRLRSREGGRHHFIFLGHRRAIALMHTVWLWAC